MSQIIYGRSEKSFHYKLTLCMSWWKLWASWSIVKHLPWNVVSADWTLNKDDGPGGPGAVPWTNASGCYLKAGDSFFLHLNILQSLLKKYIFTACIGKIFMVRGIPHNSRDGFCLLCLVLFLCLYQRVWEIEPRIFRFRAVLKITIMQHVNEIRNWFHRFLKILKQFLS